MAKRRRSAVIEARVPDKLQALQRRDGTQRVARYNAATWAPALQRTVKVTLRCVRGTRAWIGSSLSPRRHCERSEDSMG